MLQAIPLWLKIWFRTSGIDRLAEPMHRAATAIRAKVATQTVMKMTFLLTYLV